MKLLLGDTNIVGMIGWRDLLVILLSGGGGGLRDVLLVLDWLVDRLLLVLLILGSLVRTSLLDHILTSEQIVEVRLDKLSHGVLSQGLGSLGLVEELVDKEEGGDTGKGSSQDPQLGIVNSEWGSSTKERQ